MVSTTFPLRNVSNMNILKLSCVLYFPPFLHSPSKACAHLAVSISTTLRCDRLPGTRLKRLG